MTREESSGKIQLYREKKQIRLEYKIRFNIYFKDEGQSPQEHGEELQSEEKYKIDEMHKGD